jgi:hypothetical protein
MGSFANEIMDFVKVYTTMDKSFTNSKNAKAKQKYYEEMVGVRKADNASKDVARRLKGAIDKVKLGLAQGEARRKAVLLPHQIEEMQSRAGIRGARATALQEETDRKRRMEPHNIEALDSASALRRSKLQGAAPLIPPEISSQFPGADVPTGGGAAAPGPQSALPGDENEDIYAQASDEDTASAPADEEEDTTDLEDDEQPAYGRGGAVVRHFAGGGPVENEPWNSGPAPAPGPELEPAVRAIPTQEEAAAPPAEEAPKTRGTSSSDGFDMTAVLDRWGAKQDRNPVAMALDEMAASKSTTAIAAPGSRGPVADQLSPKAAPSPPDIEQLRKVVDPRDELTRHAQTIKMLDLTTNYYANRGDLKKAATVAKMQLLHGRQMSMKLGSLAAAALEAGHKDKFLEYIRGAYDYVPDGNQLDASVNEEGNFVARVVNAEGKTVRDLGTITPGQAFKFALGSVASGEEHMRGVIAAATEGKSEIKRATEKPKAAGAGRGTKGPEGMKVSDEKNMRGMLDEEFPTSENDKGDSVDTPENKGLKAATMRVAMHPNNRKSNIGVSDAAIVTKGLIDPDPTKKGTIEAAEGGKMVNFGGASAFIPTEQFDHFISIRAQRIEAAKAKAATAAKDAAKPGFAGTVVNAIKAGTDAAATGTRDTSQSRARGGGPAYPFEYTSRGGGSARRRTALPVPQ